ncbi:hypothetical protein MPL3356_120005 [Mesorhizobium plurifarium]|uniref:Uncharacterized protein n=1 Tax=Mesorhizobium plurifarium TaxID=69974 RepID=A0A090EZF3_MESPL|nr:hypothetical protein MPL3356_120005 [Mesorhizobium plurifarium]
MDADAHAGSRGGGRHRGHSAAQAIQSALSALVRFRVSGICVRSRDLLADDHTTRNRVVLTEFENPRDTDTQQQRLADKAGRNPASRIRAARTSGEGGEVRGDDAASPLLADRATRKYAEA